MPIDDEQIKSAEICFGTSCNFCERGCPIYQSEKVRTLSSRGKNRITLGLSKGKIQPSKELMDALLLCTGCGNCDRWCALPNTKNFRKLRCYLIDKGFENDKHKKNVGNIKKFGTPYADEEKNNWQKDFKFSPQSKTLLFVGCTTPSRERKTLDAAVKLLDERQLMVMKDEPCCGSYPMRTGYLSLHEELTERLLKYIDDNDICNIVTICAGCYSTLKESLAEKRPNVKVSHVVEKIAEDVKSGKIQLLKKYGKLTYHDPCHLGRLGEVFDPPREILSKIGTLVEMKHNKFESQCCGAGAGVRAVYPDVATKIAKKRISEANETDAKILVTACPFCEGLLRSAGGIEVKDILQLTAECKA